MSIKLSDDASSVDSLEGRDGLNFVVKSVVDNVSECNSWLVGWVVQVGERVLHPFVIEALCEVVSGVGATGLLSVLSSVHRHLSLDHEVLELHGFNEIGVPDIAAIADTDVSDFL